MDKYLVISSEFPPGPGGIGKHAYSLIKSMVKYNTHVDIICDMNYAPEEEMERFIASQPPVIKINRIKRQGVLTYIKRISESLAAVKKNNYKKVIVTGKYSIWVGGIIKMRYGKKVCVECFVHGSEVKLASKLQANAFNACLRRMDKIWAVSHFTRSLMQADILELGTTGIIPNGLNIEDWPVEKNSSGKAWKGYPRLLTVGHVSPRKGQHCVVKALPAIKKKFPDVHYHIVGLASNAAYINKLAAELNVTEHITIHGKVSQEELIASYENADIFCMLSENQANGDVEGFGIAILEANVMGVPAIGSKGCGIEDAVEPGNNGYLVDPENPVETVNAIELLLKTDPDKLKAACIKWAKQHDWDLLAKKIL